MLREQELQRVWRRYPLWSRFNPVCSAAEQGSRVQNLSALPALRTTRNHKGFKAPLNPSGSNCLGLADSPNPQHIFNDYYSGRRWCQFSVFTTKPSHFLLSERIWAPDNRRYFENPVSSPVMANRGVSSQTYALNSTSLIYLFFFFVIRFGKIQSIHFNTFNPIMLYMSEEVFSLFVNLQFTWGSSGSCVRHPDAKKYSCQPTSTFKLANFS